MERLTQKPTTPHTHTLQVPLPPMEAASSTQLAMVWPRVHIAHCFWPRGTQGGGMGGWSGKQTSPASAQSSLPSRAVSWENSWVGKSRGSEAALVAFACLPPSTTLLSLSPCKWTSECGQNFTLIKFLGTTTVTSSDPIIPSLPFLNITWCEETTNQRIGPNRRHQAEAGPGSLHRG